MRPPARLVLNRAPRRGEVARRPRALLCRLGCHEAEPEGAFHGAHYHSRCRGCGAAMVRRGASWSMVPARRF